MAGTLPLASGASIMGGCTAKATRTTEAGDRCTSFLEIFMREPEGSVVVSSLIRWLASTS